MSFFFIVSLIPPGTADRSCHQDRSQHNLDLGCWLCCPMQASSRTWWRNCCPDLMHSRTTQRTVKGVKRALDPEGDLRRLAQTAEISGGVDASQRHAEELLRLGRPAEAIPVFQRILRGLYEHDPNLMLGAGKSAVRRWPGHRRTHHPGCADAAQPGIPLRRGTPALCAGTGAGRAARTGTGRIQGSGRLLSGRRSARALCTIAARTVPGRTWRSSSCGICSTRRQLPPPTIDVPRKTGSSRRSGKSPHSEGS